MKEKFVGFDIGTGNLVCARALDISDKDKIKAEITMMRNMFIPVSKSDITLSELSNSTLKYIEVYETDGSLDKIAVIGEDAFKWANIFGGEVRRPMNKGVISNKESDAYEIVAGMISDMIKSDDEDKYEKKYCVYSVPASPIDENIPSVKFHEAIFNQIFSKLGYTSMALNEGMAIIYSNCKKENYTGIGISFGAGLTNISISYKGIPAITFSIGRGGDWIDYKSAEATGKMVTRITSLKENKLSLLPATIPNEKRDERRIKDVVRIFYTQLMEYTLEKICKKIEEYTDNISIDMPVPIILSGGTSMIEGFKEKFEEIFNDKYINMFPFEISEIRYANDQLTSVAQGCLEYNVLTFVK